MKKVSVKDLQTKVEGLMNEHAKKIILGLLIATVCGIGGCSLEDVGRVKNGKEAKELTEQVKALTRDNKSLEGKNNSLEKEVDSLEKKVEIAKEYLDLDENEKELVDAKIVEVNEATEQKIAEEKARKEQEEKERKEREEAEKKAKEEEEKAKREAEEQARREAEAKEGEYKEVETFVRNSALQSGANYVITREGSIITCTLNAGDVSISEAKRNTGADSATLRNLLNYDGFVQDVINGTMQIQSIVDSNFNTDVEIRMVVKYGGEKAIEVDGRGNVLYDILK